MIDLDDGPKKGALHWEGNPWMLAFYIVIFVLQILYEDWYFHGMMVGVLFCLWMIEKKLTPIVLDMARRLDELDDVEQKDYMKSLRR